MLVTGATAAIGAVAMGWALVNSMNPAADVIAAGAPIDVDISKLEPGQQMVILWRGAPMLVVNRPPDALKTLQTPAMVGLPVIPIPAWHSSRHTRRTGIGR